MKKTIALGLMLLLAACATELAPPSAPQGPQEFACKVGEHVDDPAKLPSTVRLAYFAVEQSLAVLPFVDNGTVVGDYSLALFKAARAGSVPFWGGHGTIRVAIHNVFPGHMPQRVALVGEGNICQGMLPVKQVASRVYVVDVPMGKFAALAFARAVINTPNHKAWACAQALDFKLAYAPALTAGPYKDDPDLLCGLPTDGGRTRLGSVAIDGAGTLTPLIIKSGG